MLIARSGKRRNRPERTLEPGGGEMAIFDDEPKKKPPPHEIGQDLSLLSAGELSDRIALLRAEIARIEAELKAKGATRSAAEDLFRRS
jgi:uncharacterized small protein (DUF1192 family)